VSDAGLGKTNLLCRFAESFPPDLAMLFVAARDLSWEVEDTLVRYVVQKVEGVLEAHVRCGEEQHITRLLQSKWPITIVLDGLDETHEPDRVRRALRNWFTSRLATESTLIVSSRPQFWALCCDELWDIWIPKMIQRGGKELSDSNRPVAGRGIRFELPDVLTAAEQEVAWTRAGRSINELLALAPEIRTELRHPFTLRAFLELDPILTSQQTAISRASILSWWIDQRLRTEASEAEFLTRDVYWRALTGLARLLDRSRKWVDFDALHGIPRWDPVHPPGPAMKRLVSAGLVDVSTSGMQVRFAQEIVADFFIGELDVEGASKNPQLTATELLGPAYSKVVLRLEVVGQHVKEAAPPLDFVQQLAQHDAARAVVVMLGSPGAFEARQRAEAVSQLESIAISRFKARAAHAIDLLSRFQCSEARRALRDTLLPVAACPEHLRYIGALAVARAGVVEAAGLTYQWPIFRRSDTYYFGDIVHVLRNSNIEFQNALIALADSGLQCESGSEEHIRAVNVLGYLGSHRVVEHLRSRLEAAGELWNYENHALIAVGTEAAAGLFELAANAAARKIQQLGWDDGGRARYKLFCAVAPVTADLRHLFTPAFETCVQAWLVSTLDRADEESLPRELKLMALSLARESRSRALAKLYVMAKEPYVNMVPHEPVLEWLDPRDWSDWWAACQDEDARHALVNSLPGVPTRTVEAALITALRDKRVAWKAARYLGDCGALSAKPALRDLVVHEIGDELDEFTSIEAVRALGKLGDEDAIGLLTGLAETSSKRLMQEALASLALIGTPGSEDALHRLSSNDDLVEFAAGALVIHGSQSAVKGAIARCAGNSDRGARWLVKSVNEILSGWGWKRGGYFTHIHEDFGTFLQQQKPRFDGAEKWEYFRFLERFDGESIRVVLREMARRSGTEGDDILRESDGLRASRLAYNELFERGDPWALPELLRQCTDEQAPFARTRAEKLLHFPREVVADAIRRLRTATEGLAGRAELDRLLGFFGGETDQDSLRRDSESPNDVLANAADEAHLRITDPLRLPSNWSSLCL
jgi:HEAT repeat protein